MKGSKAKGGSTLIISFLKFSWSGRFSSSQNRRAILLKQKSTKYLRLLIAINTFYNNKCYMMRGSSSQTRTVDTSWVVVESLDSVSLAHIISINLTRNFEKYFDIICVYASQNKSLRKPQPNIVTLATSRVSKIPNPLIFLMLFSIILVISVMNPECKQPI